MTNKCRIEYLPIAEKDLLDIFDYIHTDNPIAAADFIDKIDHAVSKLESFPKMGKVPSDDKLSRQGYRMLIIDNYIVFYIVFDNTVEIRRIIHGSRKYSFLL